MGVIKAYEKLTLAEVNAAAGYDDAMAVLGELGQRNEPIDEMPWFPATHGAHTEYYKARRLGSGDFTGAHDGVPVMSSSGNIIKEPVKLYQADSAVNDIVLKGADDPRAARDAQDAMNLEGFIQEWLDNLLYGDESADPDTFKSFDRRRAKLSTYCKGGGGTGSDLTSLWLLELGKAGFYLTYNKSGVAGIKNEDMGLHRQANPDDSTRMDYMWIRHYEIWAGIVLRNERALQRYANIESSGSSNIFDPSTFIGMKNQLPSAGRYAVAFANRTLHGQIEANAYNKSNMAYSLRDIEGFGPVLHVAGVPVRMWETILDAETALTA
jgi:hypothetical protein